MKWFKRHPAKPKKPALCGYCGATSTGTVHGWPLCAEHLAMVLARV